jgi:hypothetical protein
MEGEAMRVRVVVAAGLSVAALLAAGCSSTTAENSPDVPVVAPASPTAVQEVGPPPELQIGTGGELIPIQSDNVQAAGYDAGTGVMTVLFDSGGLYEYYNVPAGLWEAFVAAQPHPWSNVGDPQLVKGGYRYQRIG